jgi:hypothetical protein
MGEQDELAADANQADELGAELVQPVGRDEIEQLPGQDEIERPRRELELDRGRRRHRLSGLPLRDRLGQLDLVDVHARPAAGEEDDALAAQRAQDEDLGLPLPKRACDRPAEPAAWLARGSHGSRIGRTRT